MKRVLSFVEAERFYLWLEAEIREDEQHAVEQAVHALLRERPEILTEKPARGWDEIARMALEGGAS